MDLSQAQQQPSLAAKAVRGSLWVGAGKYVNYVVSFVSGILLARLLAPEDFGVVVLAMATFGILSKMSSVGIDVAIIQRKDEDPVVLSTLFWVLAGIAITVFLIALPIAFFSGFFDVLTAQVFLIVALFRTANNITHPAGAILRRRFQFKQLALIDIGITLPSSIAAVAMAFLGFGVWSLVWPVMAALLLKGLLLWRASRWLPKLVFDWDVVRDLKRFAMRYFCFGVLEEFIHKIDDVLLGRIGGTTSLGFYSKAYNTSGMFHASVGGAIATTALPLFSRYREESQRLRRAYELVIKTVLKLGGLFYITLAPMAYEVIGLLYGKKWQPLVPVLWAMLPYALLLPAFELSRYLLIAVGRIGDVVRVYMVMAVVLLVGLIPGILLFDAIGAAVAVDAMIIVGFAYQMVRVAKILQVDVAAIVFKALGLILVQAMLLLVVREVLMPCVPWLLVLVIGVMSIGLFVALAWVFDRSWLLSDMRLVWAAARGKSLVA